MISDARAEVAIPPEDQHVSFIREFCKYSQFLSDGPLVYSLGAAMGAIATIAPSHLELRLGARIPATFWGLLVGGSGSRKTTMITQAREILDFVVPERLGSEHVSEDSLIESLAKQPQQLHIFTEFGTFLSGTRAGGRKQELRPRYTQIWDGNTIRKEGKKSGMVEAKNPCVSVLAGSAPAFIEQHSTLEDWSNGFYPRFVILAGQREREVIGTRNWKERRQALASLMNHLVAQYSTIGECEGLSEEGAAVFREWWEGPAATRFKPQMKQPHLEGFYERLPGTVFRLAMLYSLDCGVARNAPPKSVWFLGPKEISLACRLAELHAESVLWLTGSIALNPYARARRSILLALGEEALSFRRLMQKVSPQMHKKDLSAFIESLMEEGVIRQTMIPGEGNPRWHSADVAEPKVFL